jgi:hypothetical protein
MVRRPPLAWFPDGYHDPPGPENAPAVSAYETILQFFDCIARYA